MSVETSQIKDKNLVLCACGRCGQLITPVDKQGRKRQYVNGHNPNVKKRTKTLSKKFTLDKKSRGELIMTIAEQAEIIKQKDVYIQEMESDIEFNDKIRRFQEKELSDRDARIIELQDALLELNPELNLDPQ